MKRLTRCACGKTSDAHGSVRGASPREGDLSICWGCRQLSYFDLQAPGGLRPLTTDERKQLVRENPDIGNYLHAMAESYTPEQALGLVRRRMP